MASSAQPNLPGRLGDSARSLKNDPRTDPRLVAALAEFGLDEAAPPGPVTAGSPLGEILEFCADAEVGFQGIFDTFFTELPEIKNVDRRTEVINGRFWPFAVRLSRPRRRHGYIGGDRQPIYALAR